MYGTSFLIPLASDGSTSLGLLRCRFRPAGLLVKICRAKALLTFIFPVPVFLNLFAAPRLVFSFGTLFSFPLMQDDVPCVLPRGEESLGPICWLPSIGSLRVFSGFEGGTIS